jgi:hypothetical protein
MLLNPNLEIFQGVPEAFRSPFASRDSQLSAKYQSFARAAGDAKNLLSIGERLLCQQQALAWRDGLALVNFAKATVVGDFLADMLPKVAWVGKSGPAGLFAKVAFPQTTDPAKLAEALVNVALDVAIGAVSSVPIVGQILGAVVQVARFIYKIFTTPKEAAPELLLPWETYSERVDEDIVNDFLHRLFAQGVDWTAIWLPPYELAAWELHKAARDGKEYKGGQVWAPVVGGEIPYAQGQLGCIPNTIRVAGHLQRVPGGPPVEKLARYWYDYGLIGWGGIVTNIGDFFPSTGQVAGGMWKQAERAGSPDMYKVDARAIKSAWEDYFGQFFESGFDLYAKDPSIGELLAPYICMEAKDLRLGIPNLMRPHPAPFVTPGIFKHGPGTQATWTNCLFIEENLPRKLPHWPHDRWDDKNAKLPAQHPDLNYRSPHYVDAENVAVVGDNFWRAVSTGGRNPGLSQAGALTSVPGRKVPEGYRCVEWPTPEERLTKYRRPEEAIIGPACEHLIKMQERCLESTLVCAYVRPDAVDDLEAHGAFRNNKALRDKCVVMRKTLLQHDARFRVNLRDAETADPKFAQQLRDSGVNNSPAQMSQHLGRLSAGLKGDNEPLPRPPAPAGGLPFDQLRGTREPRGPDWKTALAVGGGAAAAAGAAYYWIRGRHRDA